MGKVAETRMSLMQLLYNKANAGKWLIKADLVAEVDGFSKGETRK